MPISPEIISQILEKLKSNISGEKYSTKREESTGAVIWHYIQEINRQWNRLNYIAQKVQRAIKLPFKLDTALLALVIYQIQEEKIDSQSALNEMHAYSAKFNSELPSDTDLKYLLKRIQSFSWDKALSNKSDLERLSLEVATPSFTIDRLVPVMDIISLKNNLNVMYSAHSMENIAVRFNSLALSQFGRISKEDVLSQLVKEDGLHISSDPSLSDLFLIPAEQKQQFIQSDWYQKGLFIFQDRSSLIPPILLNPQPNELIGDFCAAPGMKTSYIAQLSNNKARIIACDVHSVRIRDAKMLLARMKVKNIELIQTDAIKFPSRFHAIFDKILLDAPCTGSGTFGTNPELKSRQNNQFLHQNMTLQTKLLESVYELLKPDGILVYSTCSLYPEEGELQIKKILSQYKPMVLPDWISPSYVIDGEKVPGTGRLFPFQHQSQGFFFACLKKQ